MTTSARRKKPATTDRPTGAPNLWALLIGIDCYMGRTMSGLPNYRSLSGCVNDILLMDEFLRARLNVPEARIRKLTASGASAQPQEPREQWPTKANIVAAFNELAQQAQPGDQVYIHYSGHGGRALTVFPQIKGEDGLDESLVPTDYGQIEDTDDPEDRYVRDLELAALLKTLVDRGLTVVTVLDSCHSGGAARGEDIQRDMAARSDVAVRGGAAIDEVRRRPSNLVEISDAFAAGWEQQGRITRSAQLASGWMPDPDGYTLVAACRALELAREYQAPNGKRHGALSYWLWDALQRPAPTWEAVFQQALGRVHGAFNSQTPQLQGEGDRRVFGGAALAMPSGVTVLEVVGDRLRLNAGQSLGIGTGAQFFVYPPDTTDFRETDRRLAVVIVDEVMDAESWATVVRRLESRAEIMPGAQALLFDPGVGRQRAVRLVRDGLAPAEVEEKALAGLAAALAAGESRFVRLAAEGEPAFFQVGVTKGGAFDIRNDGGLPLPNLPEPTTDPDEAVHRLTHLAKYFNVWQLTSPDSMSSLAGKLEVRLMRTPTEPFNEAGGIPTVKPGQVYYLRIRNLFEPMDSPPNDSQAYLEELGRRTMNVTVLNLGADWSITRLLPPAGEGEEYYELGPGKTLVLPDRLKKELPALASAVPEGVEEADDVFKVFATTETTGYDSLQLPPLDEGDRNVMRAMVVNARSQEPERAWITTQVMVHIVKQ